MLLVKAVKEVNFKNYLPFFEKSTIDPYFSMFSKTQEHIGHSVKQQV